MHACDVHRQICMQQVSQSDQGSAPSHPLGELPASSPLFMLFSITLSSIRSRLEVVCIVKDVSTDCRRAEPPKLISNSGIAALLANS